MKKYIFLGLLICLASCLSSPTFINGTVAGNKYKNDYLELTIPQDWNVRKAGGHFIFTIQKQINTNGSHAFPTVHLEAGTINENSFSTYYQNSFELAEGSYLSFSKNKIYKVIGNIDSTYIHDIKMYSFETNISNEEFKLPDLLQTHYYFNIDTMFFHLSVSNYDRFEELKNDYSQLLQSIKKK